MTGTRIKEEDYGDGRLKRDGLSWKRPLSVSDEAYVDHRPLRRPGNGRQTDPVPAGLRADARKNHLRLPRGSLLRAGLIRDSHQLILAGHQNLHDGLYGSLRPIRTLASS